MGHTYPKDHRLHIIYNPDQTAQCPITTRVTLGFMGTCLVLKVSPDKLNLDQSGFSKPNVGQSKAVKCCFFG